MDFFNKLGKKASETYQVTKEKTVKFSEEVKLKMKLNETKAEIENLYKEIGENVYTQYKTNTEEMSEEIKDKCEKVSNKFDEISKIESDILKLRKVKKCIECKEEIEENADFCPKCGKPQPKEEKINVEENVSDEEMKDADVTEINNAADNDNN